MHKDKEHVLSGFSIQNLGPVEDFKADKLGGINLFLGENSCGKTYMMKMLYVACKTMEQYRRGRNIATLEESLREKIHWTFQVEPIHAIITRQRRGKKAAGEMCFTCSTQSGDELQFGIKPRSSKVQVQERETPFCRALPTKAINSVFLPAKEVLTGYDIIVKSREDDSDFGFDDTYYDLAKILQRPPTKGKSFEKIARARAMINDVFHAKAEYDSALHQRKIAYNGEDYRVEAVSEGIKKLSILDILLGNRYIRPGSIVFVDEPESALHPSAISHFMEAIFEMSRDGIQFFMATHSYFVVKKLENLAKAHNVDMPVFSHQGDADEKRWVVGNMKEGIPDNPIVAESIALYREELDRLF